MKIKKIVTGFMLVFVLLVSQNIIAQESAAYFKKNITVGVDVFTDFWTNLPATLTTRTINQSANVYAAYNFRLGEKKTGKTILSLGLGIGNHSLYSKTGFIKDVKADTIQFIPAGTGQSLRRSKMTITSFEIPLELKIRLKKGFHMGVGFKLSYVFDSKEEFTGTLAPNGPERTIKYKGISRLNTVGYSPTLRFGYKSINIFAAYQLVPIFQTSHGPALHPISVGITLTPF